MVVTFVQPQSGAPFGPGFLVSLDSDFVGPIPADSWWLLYVAPAADPEVGELNQTILNPQHDHAWIAFAVESDPFPLQPVASSLIHGDTVSVTAELHSPTAVLDSGTVSVQWDMVSGVPYVMQGIVNRVANGTAEHQALIAETNAAVHMDFGDLGRFGLGQLFNGVPQIPLRRHLFTPDRTGEGSLDHPIGPLDFAAFGIYWEFIARPPGAGTVEGAPDRTARRALDLRQVAKDVEANEYTRDSFSFNEDRLYLTFSPLELTRIEYWIEPGTTVRFYWLGLP